MLQHLKPLIKDSSVYALGNISSKIVGFILLPFYVDKLTTAEYGMLGTLEVTFQLIVALAGLNLYVAFTRWYSDKELQGRQQSAFFTLFTVITFIAVFLNIGCYPLAPDISQLLFDSGNFSHLVRLMLCSAGLELIGTIPATLCRVNANSVQYTWNVILRLAVVLALTILFIVVLDRKLEGIYEAQIIGGLFYIVLFIPYIIRNSIIKFEKRILGKMFRYSLPLILSSSFGVLLSVADRFSLNFISGLVSVGVYSLGFKLANALKMLIVQPVSLALPPVIFQMVDQPNAKRFYSKIMTYFTFGLMFCVIGVSLFGQEAVKLLTAKEPAYWEAYRVIPFIAFGIVFGMMKDQAIYSLQIVKRTGVIASVIAFVSVLNVGLNILLIPYMGAVGAALATLFAQMTYFGIMLRFAQRYYSVPYEFRKIFLSIGIGALYCVVAFLIKDWSLTLRLVIKTAMLASYPFVLYLFRFYDKKELQALLGFWKKWKNPGKWKENIGTLKF